MWQITNFKHFAKFVLPYSVSIHKIFNTHTTHTSVLVAECGIFSCSMWDLLPWLGIKPRLLVLGVQSLATGPPGKSPHTIFFLEGRVVFPRRKIVFLPLLRAKVISRMTIVQLSNFRKFNIDTILLCKNLLYVFPVLVSPV